MQSIRYHLATPHHDLASLKPITFTGYPFAGCSSGCKARVHFIAESAQIDTCLCSTQQLSPFDSIKASGRFIAMAFPRPKPTTVRPISTVLASIAG